MVLPAANFSTSSTICQGSFNLPFPIVSQASNPLLESTMILFFCLKSSILEIMEKLQEFSDNFLMDGNTNFGIQNLQKEIKADAKYASVSAASILAKVSRDRFMDEISPLYANYNFHKHKGYGTKAHIEAIREFGRSDIHRFSFKLKALGETESLLQKTLF